MLEIHARNVEQALYHGVVLLRDHGFKVSPRGKVTLEAPCPVATTYEFPRERVLLNEVRDANPFFHFMESLWILAGREDVEFVSRFNSNIASFSDDGVRFHAPYGYRLRQHINGDQFEKVIRLFQEDPDTRRAVLQIWSSRLDLAVDSKDIPCNDLVFFKIRDGRLNMTVCNRSNDMIWGAYGANAVQFSVIQEYLAGRLGVEVGEYVQMSDSFHVYIDNPQWSGLLAWADTVVNENWILSYPQLDIHPYPMVCYPDQFDKDLYRWFAQPNTLDDYVNPFFNDVAVPMYVCWTRHKKFKDALTFVDDIKASDWKLACYNWLKRREKCQN